jgi:hypothetical protein
MFEQRDLLRKRCGATYRVLAVFPDSDTPVAYVLNMDDEKAVPYAVPLAQLTDEMKSGELSRVTEADPTSARPSRRERARLRHFSAASQLTQRRKDLVRPLAEDVRVLDAKHHTQLIAHAAQHTGASAATLMKLLRQYWHGEMKFDALFPDPARCGPPAPRPRRPPYA